MLIALHCFVERTVCFSATITIGGSVLAWLISKVLIVCIALEYLLWDCRAKYPVLILNKS